MEEKELAEALKAVEEELNLAKRVYLAFPFLFWAAVLPLLYLLTLILNSYAGISWDWASSILSILVVAWFIVENERVFKKVEAIERVLGMKREKKKAYLVAQISAWIISALVASLAYTSEGEWMLAFVGLALLLMAAVDFVFVKRAEWEVLLGGLIILSSISLVGKLPLPRLALAVMVISMAFAFVAFLYIRKAMRE
ncbi:hypothetical protein A3L09_03975 [Thermococcus profundus]|uniref:Uncharacterized protein n=2 Tax=Thermococcus profundus TaxID=49899 RepID=A0A2Z2MJ64_THEPR|nr:hypothetical protein A3L09_03975 [Thermococcus profundus]